MRTTRTSYEQTHDRLSEPDQYTTCPDNYPAPIHTGGMRLPSWWVPVVVIIFLALVVGAGLWKG